MHIIYIYSISSIFIFYYIYNIYNTNTVHVYDLLWCVISWPVSPTPEGEAKERLRPIRVGRRVWPTDGCSLSKVGRLSLKTGDWTLTDLLVFVFILGAHTPTESICVFIDWVNSGGLHLTNHPICVKGSMIFAATVFLWGKKRKNADVQQAAEGWV